MIVVITSISEWVNSCNNTGVIGYYCTNAPGVVGVACYNFALVVGNGNNIPLQVLKEIVCVVVVDNTADGILVVVERNKGIVTPGFLEYLSSVKSVLVLNAVYSLACSYAVGILGICITVKLLELASLFPSQSMTEVLNRVALSIILNRFTLYTGEQVVPG